LKKKSIQGFQRLNPFDIKLAPSLGKQIAGCILNTNNSKKYLAEKILSKKKLTIPEKEDIYRYLTGNEPPCIREKGRPSTMGRDMAMAIDFLFLRKTIINTDEIMDTLRKYDKKYGIESILPISDNAIYAAINRGVAAIKERASLLGRAVSPTGEICEIEIRFDTDYENGYLCDLTDNDGELKQKTADFKELNSLIDEYVNEKVLRRTRK